MRFCWDNLENIKLTKKGNFRDVKKKITYKYIEMCKNCKEPFLSQRDNKDFCCISCLNKYYKTGSKHSEESKKKMSKSRKGKKRKPFSKETRENMSRSAKNGYKNGRIHPLLNKHHTDETKKKLSLYKGKLTSNWKGGYSKKGIPTYNTYVNELEWCEEVRRNSEDPNILEVKCFKCGEWFIPKLNSVHNRTQYLKGNCISENRFYCSDQCKNTCSIFNKSYETLMKEDAIRAGRLPWIELTREVQHELRKMVLERDEYRCIKCGETENIQCHHIMPVNIEPLLSADVDNCVTLCVDCHKEAHKKDGCRYNQLGMEEC